MNLTTKIYLMEYLGGMIFYCIGIFLITPPTNPEIVKYIGIGGMLLILLSIWAYAYLQKDEKLDERGFNNLSKASNVTILIVLFFLFLSGVLLLLLDFHINFSPAIVSFALATILVSHATTFRTLEVKGN